MEIEMGSVYKLDHHTKLPRSTTLPSSLNSIKAVMVNSKSDENVTVVFPSMKSVRNFFGNKKVKGLMQPNLDEHFVMNLNVGKKLLASKVPFEEFAAQRGNRSFWVNDDDDDDHDHDDGDDDDDHEGDDHQVSSDGGLEIRWKKRRRTTTKVYRRNKISVLPSCVEKEEDEDEEEEEEKEEKKIIPEKTRILKKRKCHLKGVKKYCETKSTKKKSKGKISEKKFKDSQHRWTVERYKLAEKNMLKILKEKGAGPGNPILRPELRTEARKLIGDTGLLDHLLKHMAGKVAPGGKERFRRRHNPEGAMEYWIESADLIEIRKQAGVSDPYWVPPPGWKPGDCPNQDPVCATLLKELKDEVGVMKRELEKLACGRGNDVDPKFEKSIESLKQRLHDEQMKKKAEVEKQLLEISKIFSEMEEDIGWLRESEAEETQGDEHEHEHELVMGRMAEENNKNQKASAINEADHHHDHDHDERSQKKGDMIMLEAPQKQSAEETAVAVGVAEEEDKEEKRKQKLKKSGFRICKPEGTFVWPSEMASFSTANQVVVHLEDLLGCPTPPSVSSSSSCSKPPPPPHHHQHQHQVPRVMKPVATRAAVSLNCSIATFRDSICSRPTTSTTTAARSFVLDLNEVPLTNVA